MIDPAVSNIDVHRDNSLSRSTIETLARSGVSFAEIAEVLRKERIRWDGTSRDWTASDVERILNPLAISDVADTDDSEMVSTPPTENSPPVRPTTVAGWRDAKVIVSTAEYGRMEGRVESAVENVDGDITARVRIYDGEGSSYYTVPVERLEYLSGPEPAPPPKPESGGEKFLGWLGRLYLALLPTSFVVLIPLLVDSGMPFGYALIGAAVIAVWLWFWIGIIGAAILAFFG